MLVFVLGLYACLFDSYKNMHCSLDFSVFLPIRN